MLLIFFKSASHGHVPQQTVPVTETTTDNIEQ